ncbi:MAG: hypothetical protein IPG63_10650 [Xanthomonadales bacterium]|nr:hypothetical protein [Xanthomonadales bacterium]
MEVVSNNKWLQRTTVFARYLNLLRQYNTVNDAISSLLPEQRRSIALTALAELTRAETSDQEPVIHEATNWSVEAAVAFARVRSPHSAIRLAGLKRWLVCAYRATFNSPYGEVQNLHRLVLRALRQMHGEEQGKASDLRRDQHRYA